MDTLEYIFYGSILLFILYLSLSKLNRWVKIINFIIFILYTGHHLKLRFYPTDHSGLMGLFFQLPLIICGHIILIFLAKRMYIIASRD
jgi:uncharacterized membrane protein